MQKVIGLKHKVLFILWVIFGLFLIITAISCKNNIDKFEKDDLEFSRKFNWQYRNKEIQVYSLDRYKTTMYSDNGYDEYDYSFYFIKYDNLTDNCDMYVCYLIREGLFEMSYAAKDLEVDKEVFPAQYYARKQALAEGEHKSFPEEEWKELLKLYDYVKE